jgi:hypothetical protein
MLLALGSPAPAVAKPLMQHAPLATAQQPAANAKSAAPKPKRTAMKIPEPGGMILFGGAIMLLLIARRFGRALHAPLPEERWQQD